MSLDPTKAATIVSPEERVGGGPIMDPRKLLYFASIVEHGSIKKAAKHLLISQPALSTSMDRFEQSLGSRLLDRGPTGVTATPLGEVVYAHARLIREELECAERRLSGAAPGAGDLITFGGIAEDVQKRTLSAALC